MKYLVVLLLLVNLKLHSQVGIGTTSPQGILDVNSTTDGLLIPRVALTASNVAAPLTTPVISELVYNTMASGVAPNNVTPGYYYWNGSSWIRLATGTNSDWSLQGNTGTNATTDFVGTTDAQDLVLRTQNIERLRINNAVSPITGTEGDISIGTSNSGTIKSNRELVLRQDGDTFGSSVLRLRNRNGENGVIYENLNPTPAGTNLVDFIFRTGTTASPITSNIRFETRSSSRKVTGNTTEWQFGQPDNLNGGPTLVIGANGTSGTGSNSAFLLGNVGIGTGNSTGKLHIFEQNGTAPSANGVGTLVIEHGNNGGQSSIVFPSAFNKTSDYGYIRYHDDLSGNGSSSENSLLEIGVENDNTLTSFQDDIAIMPSGNLGVGTRAPKAKLHNNGTTAFTTATSGINNTILLLNGGTFTTPAASADNSGVVYIIRNTLSGGGPSNTVTVTNIIDYNSTTPANFSLTPSIGSIMIVSNGTNWFRID